MNDKPLIYLASPLTHDDEHVVTDRIHATKWNTRRLLGDGHNVISPVVYGVAFEDLEPTWDYWRIFDLTLLEKCDELWVLTLDGWRESVGVKAEIDFAVEHGMTIRFIEPEII